MKKLLISAVLMMMFVLGVNAEEQQKFSPEKFQADLEQFITNEAGFTTEEAASKRAIQRRDQYEIELRSIQQTYHNKFLKVVSATKVYKSIIAEDQFHRRAFRNWGQGGHRGGPRK